MFVDKKLVLRVRGWRRLLPLLWQRDAEGIDWSQFRDLFHCAIASFLFRHVSFSFARQFCFYPVIMVSCDSVNFSSRLLGL